MQGFITSRKVFSLPILAVAFAVAALTSFAKPPGSGGDSTGGGTIYFENSSLGFASMNADGSNKSSLSIDQGEPSYGIHDEHRWFLQVRLIAGEYYPNGATRRELFAVRDDGGQVVQLTNQPNLEVWWRGFRWTSDDAAVSWTGRFWKGIVDPETGERSYIAVEGGIYAGFIDFGPDGPMLREQPSAPLVPVQMIVTEGAWEPYEAGPTLAPDLSTHDWEPFSTAIVYSPLDAHELCIANLVGGERVRILQSGRDPVWSPAGDKIAFTSYSGIETINPDGTGRKAIIQSTATVSVYGPRWSPTGSHLVYSTYDHKSSGSGLGPLYVYRATANGGGKTNLTKNSTYSYPVAWR